MKTSKPSPSFSDDAVFASRIRAAAFLDCNGREVLFAFEDPHAQGDILHRRFEAGMFPRVDAKILFSARGFLRDEMARLQGRGRHAKDEK